MKVMSYLSAQYLRCVIIKNWGTHSAIWGNAPWPLGRGDRRPCYQEHTKRYWICWVASKKSVCSYRNSKHKQNIAYWNYIVLGRHITKKVKNKQTNLYSALCISPLSLALIYGPYVTRRSPSFTCHPHTNRTGLYSPAARRHRPLTGTHCTFQRKDSQAELTWVAEHVVR